jgi:hypothetical protein
MAPTTYKPNTNKVKTLSTGACHQMTHDLPRSISQHKHKRIDTTEFYFVALQPHRSACSLCGGVGLMEDPRLLVHD